MGWSVGWEGVRVGGWERGSAGWSVGWGMCEGGGGE